MRRSNSLVLGLLLCTTPLAAQHRDPNFDPGAEPFHVGLSLTVAPIVAGVALMVAGKGDWEQGPTTAGFLLATGGLLLGPSAGDWVGGLGGRGFARFGLRTAALVGGFMGGYSNNAGAEAAFLGGLGVAVGLAVWDLATVKGAVRRHQAKSVSLVPILRPDSHAVGVAVHLTF